MKNKLFTSTNSKKGVFLETEGDKITISIWKKEAPVPVVVEKDVAIEIADFIIDELGRGEKNSDLWSNHVEQFITARVNKRPKDEEEREFPEKQYCPSDDKEN